MEQNYLELTNEFSNVFEAPSRESSGESFEAWKQNLEAEQLCYEYRRKSSDEISIVDDLSNQTNNNSQEKTEKRKTFLKMKNNSFTKTNSSSTISSSFEYLPPISQYSSSETISPLNQFSSSFEINNLSNSEHNSFDTLPPINPLSVETLPPYSAPPFLRTFSSHSSLHENGPSTPKAASSTNIPITEDLINSMHFFGSFDMTSNSSTPNNQDATNATSNLLDSTQAFQELLQNPHKIDKLPSNSNYSVPEAVNLVSLQTNSPSTVRRRLNSNKPTYIFSSSDESLPENIFGVSYDNLLLRSSGQFSFDPLTDDSITSSSNCSLPLISPPVSDSSYFSGPSSNDPISNPHLEEQIQASETMENFPKTLDNSSNSLYPTNISEELKDILSLIEWNPYDHVYDKPQKSRRKRGQVRNREEDLEIRKDTEKQRREEMNELIGVLRSRLPYYEKKFTKMETIFFAGEYIKRLQDLCIHLNEENKALREQRKRRRASDPGTRKLFSIFLFCLTFMTLNQWGSQLNYLSLSSSRLPLTEESSVYYTFIFSCINYLFYPLWFLFYGLITIIIFEFLGEIVKDPNSPEFITAKLEVQAGENEYFSGKLKHETLPRFSNALRILKSIPSESSIVYLILVLYEIMRQILHRLRIGLYLERLIMYLRKGTPEFGTMICKSSSWILQNYEGEPDIQWLYLALSSINCAEVLAPSKVNELKASCMIRITGNLSVVFRVFELFLDWDLSNFHFKDSHDKVLQYRVQALHDMTNAKFESAHTLLMKTLDIASLHTGKKFCDLSIQTYELLGILFMRTGNWVDSTFLFRYSLQLAVEQDHQSGKYWGLLGLILCLLKLNNVENAEKTLHHFVKSFANSQQPCYDQISFQALKAFLEFKKKQFTEALNTAEYALQEIRYSFKDVSVFSVTSYQILTEVILALFEESLKETSCMSIGTQNKLRQMAGEACTILNKISVSFSMIQPAVFICQGQYHFLLGNFEEAATQWQLAFEIADKLKLNNEKQQVVAICEKIEKVKRALLMKRA